MRFQLDTASESLLSDPCYLLRLLGRVAEQLTARSKDGSRVMAAAFESVDSRHRQPGAVVSMETLFATARPIFSLSALSDKELVILLRMLPLGSSERGEDGPPEEADPVEVMRALRGIIPAAAWQLWAVACKARAAVFASKTVPGLALHLRDVLAGHPVEPVSVAEALQGLTTHLNLSASEAALLTDYCAVSPSTPGIDATVLHGLLFAERIPTAVEYPILAARLAEATAEHSDRLGTDATGSLALLSALRAVLSLPSPTATEDELLQDLDFEEAILSARLTGRQFYELCRKLGANFAQEQSDQLYYYLTDEPGQLSGRSIVHMYRQYFPSVSSSQFQLLQGALSRGMARTGDQLCFAALYARLQRWGSGPVPIEPYVAAVRDAGIALTAVSDLAIEWLRLKAPTRVDLILVLCMPVAPSREAVIRKLFERLDPPQRGIVQADQLLMAFVPEKIEGKQVRQNAMRWKAALSGYLAELEETALTYELFAFFWYMVSAAVEDDPTYTMVIWQAFDLTDRRGGRR